MKKKKALKIFVIAVTFLICLFISYLFIKKSPRYNVILLVADALRSDVLECYGGDAKTPNLNWLAEKGVLFENAYSTASSTMPSSVSMFTGNYSLAYGVVNSKVKNSPFRNFFYVNNKEKLLAEYLKSQNYNVMMDVENFLAAGSNNLQGFEGFRPMNKMTKMEIEFVELKTGIKIIGSTGNSFFSSNYPRLYDLLHQLLTLPKDQNFFYMKWFIDPHSPFKAPKKYRQKIPVEKFNLPKPAKFYSRLGLRGMKKLRGDELRFLKELYKAEVESIDERVGYIFKVLRDRGLMENTLIIFTSDHGESFGEHNFVGHSNKLYQNLVKVPLIISGPGVTEGKRENTSVSHLGLMPTLKDLLKGRYQDNMAGQSYGTLLKTGGRNLSQNPYFDTVSAPIIRAGKKHIKDGMVLDGYKLIVNTTGNKNSFKLFNILEDPEELKEISAENPQITRRIFNKILKKRRENYLRMRQNLKNIKKNVDLNKSWKKSIKNLKSLGYID